MGATTASLSLRPFAVLFAFSLLLSAAQAQVKGPIAVKGINPLKSGLEVCPDGQAEPQDKPDNESRSVPGFVPSQAASCEVVMPTFAGKPVKDEKARVKLVRDRVVMMRFTMNALTDTELVEMATTMLLAYGKVPVKRTGGAVAHMSWQANGVELELLASAHEPDSLHRPVITLEHRQRMDAHRARNKANMAAIGKEIRALEVMRAAEDAKDTR